MDIPLEFGELLMNESRNKLTDTYVLINEKLYYIRKITRNVIELSDNGGIYELGNSDIRSMEVYLPDSGAYKINSRYLFLKKEAKRQWKKSFSWTYYTATNLAETSDIYCIYQQKPVHFYKYDGHVWYDYLRIAELRGDNTYSLIVPEFRKEFDEFIRTGKDAI